MKTQKMKSLFSMPVPEKATNKITDGKKKTVRKSVKTKKTR